MVIACSCWLAILQRRPKNCLDKQKYFKNVHLKLVSIETLQSPFHTKEDLCCFPNIIYHPQVDGLVSSPNWVKQQFGLS